MLRFFLYLSIGVTFGVISIVARSFYAAQTVMTSLTSQSAQVKKMDQSSAAHDNSDLFLTQAQESANDAFGKTLQEQWPIDVGVFCLLSLGLAKLGTITGRKKIQNANT